MIEGSLEKDSLPPIPLVGGKKQPKKFTGIDTKKKKAARWHMELQNRVVPKALTDKDFLLNLTLLKRRIQFWGFPGHFQILSTSSIAAL